MLSMVKLCGSRATYKRVSYRLDSDNVIKSVELIFGQLTDLTAEDPLEAKGLKAETEEVARATQRAENFMVELFVVGVALKICSVLEL